LPHCAQGFPWGKLSNFNLAMARCPFYLSSLTREGAGLLSQGASCRVRIVVSPLRLLSGKPRARLKKFIFSSQRDQSVALTHASQSAVRPMSTA
jgi:hypothetical protein